MEEPLLVLRSKYRIWYEFLNRHFITLIILLGIAFLLKGTDTYSYYWVFIGIYFLFLIFYTAYNVMKYNSTVFAFYKGFFIYEHGFIKKNIRTIPYDLTRGIKIRQNLFQTILKTGDILIGLNNGGIFRNGLYLYGISDVSKNYDKICEIIAGKDIV